VDQNAFREFEHAFWDKTSDSYDRGFGHVTSQTIPYIFERLDLSTHERLLDIACGPGYVVGEGIRRKMDVVGIDFSASMIDFARQKYTEAAFQVGDAQNLPFEDGSFDGVSCNFGLLHFADPEKAIGEAYRVSRAGGCYVCSVWKPDTESAMSIIMNAVSKYISNSPDMPEGPDFFAFASEQYGREKFESAGFCAFDFDVVQANWSIQNARSFMQCFVDGGARIGGILRAQSQEVLESIERDIHQSLQSYRSGGGYCVPASIIILSGRK
jgi:ubiquinone/menaquinone biosynthesis C-methylase UbiE